MTHAQVVGVRPPSQKERAHKVRLQMESYYGSRIKAAKATGFWLFLNTFGSALAKASFGTQTYCTYVYDLNAADVL